MSHSAVMSLDKAKLQEFENRELIQQQEAMSNNLREAFGYTPGLTAKQANYRMTKMPVQAQYQDISDHIIRKDNQYQPLQRLLQEEKERVMLMEKGIDTAETTRYFIEKINEYNSILDLDHIRHNKRNYENLQKYVKDHASDGNQMKRYTGDHGQVTNFHFVLNWQNLMPVFRELSESKDQKVAQKNVKKVSPARKVAAPLPKKSAVLQKMELLFKNIEERNAQKHLEMIKNEESTVEEVETKEEVVSDCRNDVVVIDRGRSKLSAHSIITPKTQLITPRNTTMNISQYANQQQQGYFTVIKNRQYVSKANSERSTHPNTSLANTKGPRQLFHTTLYQRRFQEVIDDHPDSTLFEGTNQAKQKMITKMIDTNFDESLMIQYLMNNDLKLQSNLKKVPKGVPNNLESVDPEQLKIIEEQLANYLKKAPEELGKALAQRSLTPGTEYCRPMTTEQPKPINLTVPMQEAPTTVKEVSMKDDEKSSQNRSLPPLPAVDFQDPVYRQRRRRKRIISELIARKQPKYIHAGGTKFAVLNTPENVNFYTKMKQDGVNERLRQEYSLIRHQVLLDEEQMQSNLFVLSGPPKKLRFESTDLKHDYHDMKVSKMMKQMNKQKR